MDQHSLLAQRAVKVEGLLRTVPGSAQQCPVPGQGAMGTHRNNRGSLNIGKLFCPVGVTEHRHRLPREAAGLRSWRPSKASARGPGQGSLGGPARAEGTDLMVSRGPFSPQPLCESAPPARAEPGGALAALCQWLSHKLRPAELRHQSVETAENPRGRENLVKRK